MTHPHHTHDHAHPHPHDTRVQAPSFLRLSAAERLAAAGVAIAALWGAIFWAMS